MTFGCARSFHAPRGRLTQYVGLVAQATSQAAHAVLAARGAWITNEKTLLTRAGLDCVDEFVTAIHPDPAHYTTWSTGRTPHAGTPSRRPAYDAMTTRNVVKLAWLLPFALFVGHPGGPGS